MNVADDEMSEQEVERSGTFDSIGTALACLPEVLSEILIRCENGGYTQVEYVAILQLAYALAMDTAAALKYATEYVRLMGDDPDAILKPLRDPNQRLAIVEELLPRQD